MKNKKEKGRAKETFFEGIVELILTVVFFVIGFGLYSFLVGTERAWAAEGDTLVLLGIGCFFVVATAILLLCRLLRRVRLRLKVAIHSRDGLSLIPMKKSEFDTFYAALDASFIREERREKEDARLQLDNPLFTVYRIVDSETTVGYLTAWRVEKFFFLEHFFMREEYRNRGYGKRVMEMAKEAFGTLVLEAEPPEGSETAARRVAFYERCGFHANDHPYVQPSFHGEDPVPLVLMSYPAPLSDCDGTVAAIYKTVYHIPKK